MGCAACKMRDTDKSNKYRVKEIIHRVNSVKETYTPLNESVKNFLEKSVYCEEHGDKFSKWCTNHDVLLCEKCHEINHKRCNDVKHIADYVENVKLSTEETLTRIRDARSKLRDIKLDRVYNIATIIKQRTEILQDLENKHYEGQKNNKTKQKLQQDLTDIVESESVTIRDLIKDVQRRDSQMQDIERIMKSDTLSEMETFLTIKHLEKLLQHEEEYLDALIKGEDLQEINIVLRPDSKQNAECSTNNIRVEKKQTKLEMQQQNDYNQMQVVVPRTGRKFEVSKTFKLHHKDLKKFHDLRCCVLPNERNDYAFSTGTMMLMYDKNGTFIDVIKGLKKAVDLAPVDDNVVAVSGGLKRKFTLVDFSTKTIIKEVNTIASCFGITYWNRSLVCCLTGQGLQKINLEDFSTSDFHTENLPNHCYIAKTKQNICFSNHQTNEITALNADANVLWKFSDKEILFSPRSLTSDVQGNIYAIGLNADKVVLISADSKESVAILDNDSGVTDPCCVHFDTKSKNLLVINRNGFFSVFKVW